MSYDICPGCGAPTFRCECVSPAAPPPAEPRDKRGRGRAPSHLAVECATSIANYCVSRFPCDAPPHPMLDVPWFAERVQRCIDRACRIGRDLARELKKADGEIARLNLLLVRKNEALGVFADPRMWVRWTLEQEGTKEPVIQWNGAVEYAEPEAFARRESEADQACG